MDRYSGAVSKHPAVPERPASFQPSPQVVKAAISDAVGIALFSLLAFLAHGGKSNIFAIFGIYLVGGIISWLATRAWRSPAAIKPTGLGIWIGTVVIGQAIWSITNGGKIPVEMVIISLVILGAILLGWRALVGAGSRIKS